MISFNALLWMLVVMFAIMGAMRGVKKEVLVTISIVVGAFGIVVLEQFFPVQGGDDVQFLVRGGIIVGCAVIGYQGQRIQQIADALIKSPWRNKLFGTVLGAANGYFLVTSLLYYLGEYNYPFPFVTPAGAELGQVLQYSIPVWLVGQWAYVAALIGIVLILLVFV